MNKRIAILFVLCVCVAFACGCAPQNQLDTMLEPEALSFDATDADADSKFYRANVYDVTLNKIFAVGNLVWNK